jgi:hypothetical protein
MADPLSDANQALINAFHHQQDLIEQSLAEQQVLEKLEEVISGLKTLTLDPSSLEMKIVLNSAIDAIGILTDKFEVLFKVRDALGAADAGLATAQGVVAGEELTAAQQLQLLARFVGGIKEVLKIPGASAIFEFYAAAIESIVQYVPIIEQRAQESQRAAEQGPDYLAGGREPTEAELAQQRALDQQLAEIAERQRQVREAEEAARQRAAELRQQLVDAGIANPEETYSTAQQEVFEIVRRALRESGLLEALIARAETPQYAEVPPELIESRNARERIEMDAGQLSTAEIRALREQAAAYDEWARSHLLEVTAEYRAADAAVDAAWKRFTELIREQAAQANWDEHDLFWLKDALYRLGLQPGWEEFRDILRWDPARDGGPDNAWMPDGYRTALITPAPGAATSSDGLFASTRNRVAGGVVLAMLLLGAAVGLANLGGGGDATAPGDDAAVGGNAAASPTAAAAIAQPTVAPTELPLAISPVRATDGPEVTEYVLQIDEPGPHTFEWGGANCGSAEADGNSYAWNHQGRSLSLQGGIFGNQQLSEDECGHDEDPGHMAATIQVQAEGPTFRATCVYQGAQSGVGPQCNTVRIVPGQPLPPPPPPPTVVASGGATATPTGDPLDLAIAQTFAGGASVAWTIDFSAGDCSEYPAAYQQPVSISGDPSRDEMTLFQGAHAPTGAYPSEHTTVLEQGGAEAERYEIEFYLDGEVLMFRGSYTYLDSCTWDIDGRPG